LQNCGAAMRINDHDRCAISAGMIYGFRAARNPE
jgi:hypothetical protein